LIKETDKVVDKIKIVLLNQLAKSYFKLKFLTGKAFSFIIGGNSAFNLTDVIENDIMRTDNKLFKDKLDCYLDKIH
jgi:hypothetical protein